MRLETGISENYPECFLKSEESICWDPFPVTLIYSPLTCPFAAEARYKIVEAISSGVVTRFVGNASTAS